MPQPAADDHNSRFHLLLTPEDREIIAALQQRTGSRSRVDLVRMALRALYQQLAGHAWGTPATEAEKSTVAA